MGKTDLQALLFLCRIFQIVSEETKNKISLGNGGFGLVWLTCNNCDTKYKVSYSRKDESRYCSKGCMDSDQKRKENIRNRLIGHVHSEETKQKIAKSRTGQLLTEEHKRKIGLGLLGNKHPEETKSIIKSCYLLKYN